MIIIAKEDKFNTGIGEIGSSWVLRYLKWLMMLISYSYLYYNSKNFVAIDGGKKLLNWVYLNDLR